MIQPVNVKREENQQPDCHNRARHTMFPRRPHHALEFGDGVLQKRSAGAGWDALTNLRAAGPRASFDWRVFVGLILPRKIFSGCCGFNDGHISRLLAENYERKQR